MDLLEVRAEYLHGRHVVNLLARLHHGARKHYRGMVIHGPCNPNQDRPWTRPPTYQPSP